MLQACQEPYTFKLLNPCDKFNTILTLQMRTEVSENSSNRPQSIQFTWQRQEASVPQKPSSTVPSQKAVYPNALTIISVKEKGHGNILNPQIQPQSAFIFYQPNPKFCWFSCMDSLRIQVLPPLTVLKRKEISFLAGHRQTQTVTLLRHLPRSHQWIRSPPFLLSKDLPAQQSGNNETRSLHNRCW